jgi:hypothetical protein
MVKASCEFLHELTEITRFIEKTSKIVIFYRNYSKIEGGEMNIKATLKKAPLSQRLI